MGSWGYKALESDEGLDFLEVFKVYVKKNKSIKLEYFIEHLQREGLLGKDRDDVDYIYDNSLVALAEVYIAVKENKHLFEYQREIAIDSFSVIQEADCEQSIPLLRNKTLAYLIDYINDILNAKEDVDDIREYWALHQNGNFTKVWEEHLLDLKRKLSYEQKRESLILMIKKRPKMFVGSHSFHDLAIYIQSYEYTLSLYNIPTGYFFDKSERFDTWLHLKMNNEKSSMGWKEMIENNYAENEQVEVFWKHYALYVAR